MPKGIESTTVPCTRPHTVLLTYSLCDRPLHSQPARISTSLSSVSCLPRKSAKPEEGLWDPDW